MEGHDNRSPRFRKRKSDDRWRENVSYRKEQRPSGRRREEGYAGRKTEKRREATPQPINGKCNPLCPFFWCAKRAYQIRRDPRTGRRYVYCTWIGDECIGASCQYASCKLNYLLPDGSCAYARKQEKRTSKDMLEELETEKLDRRTKEVLHKRFGRIDYDDVI
jgi:hypothetical protein